MLKNLLATYDCKSAGTPGGRLAGQDAYEWFVDWEKLTHERYFFAKKVSKSHFRLTIIGYTANTQCLTKNNTFHFLLQEVSLKYHKSSLLTILPRNRPKLWALNARSMGNRCPTHGLSMPITWALSAHQMGIDRPTNELTFPDFSRHFFTLSTRKGRHYQFHKTEIADTCHYLDLSQQSNTINNKTKKKFPVFAYFLYLCHRIPSIKKTDSNKRRQKTTYNF